MESPEPQFNAKEHRLASCHHLSCHLASSSGFVRTFVAEGGRRARTGNGLVSPFKLLNVFTSSRVRAGIFFAPRRGETPGTAKTCFKNVRFPSSRRGLRVTKTCSHVQKHIYFLSKMGFSGAGKPSEIRSEALWFKLAPSWPQDGFRQL